MKAEKRVVRYLDNDMPASERKQFEADLLNDNSLKKLLNDFSDVNKLISESRKVSLDRSGYFNNIIPRFRESQIKTGKYILSLRPMLVLSSIILIIVSYFLFIPDSSENQINQLTLNGLSENLNEEDFDGLVRYMDFESGNFQYSEDYLGGEFNGMDYLINQISDSDYQILTEFVNKDISSDISGDEAERIYEQLIVKNFKNEVIL